MRMCLDDTSLERRIFPSRIALSRRALKTTTHYKLSMVRRTDRISSNRLLIWLKRHSSTSSSHSCMRLLRSLAYFRFLMNSSLPTAYPASKYVAGTRS